MSTQLGLAAKPATKTQVEKPLERHEWIQVFDMRANRSSFTSLFHPFEAAGRPLHSCRYIADAMFGGVKCSCK